MNKYSQTFADAMDRTGIRNVTVSAHVGTVGNNCIAQWRTGRRPIPAEHAPKVSALLGVLPETISEAYERLLLAGAIQPDAAGTGARNAPPTGHVILGQLKDFSPPDPHPRLWLPESISRRKLGLTPVENIRWALQPSWSMAPEIERHALVLIDITVRKQEDIVDGGIHAYALWGRPDIRRVLIRRGGWTLVGANPDVERLEVAEQDLEQLRIFGAVVGWI